MLGLLSAVLVPNAVLHLSVALAEGLQLNILLVDDSLEHVINILQLLHRLNLSVSQFHSVTLGGELLSSKLRCLLVDGGQLLLASILQVC